MTDFVLTIACPDRPGIVAHVSDYLSQNGMNITESHQFGSPETKRFFMRVGFESLGSNPDLKFMAKDFAPISDKFDMQAKFYDMAEKPKALVLVSKFDHCLVDLLYRTRVGALNMEIAAVFSNHLDTQKLVEQEGIPFHHAQVDKQTKAAAESEIRELIARHDSELIILARYMQVLSADLARDFPGQIINIHHSFLPSFKGAVPYSRAFERGVKMIGATAHYVTENLDEGPIIAQNVAPVRHDMTVEKMVLVGREVEQQVLANAVDAHINHRVLINSHKTVVFD
ncbi:MAG: formyltetrahydrofolate deformylase [Parvibaculales bacterium]